MTMTLSIRMDVVRAILALSKTKLFKERRKSHHVYEYVRFEYLQGNSKLIVTDGRAMLFAAVLVTPPTGRGFTEQFNLPIALFEAAGKYLRGKEWLEIKVTTTAIYADLGGGEAFQTDLPSEYFPPWGKVVERIVKEPITADHSFEMPSDYYTLVAALTDKGVYPSNHTVADGTFLYTFYKAKYMLMVNGTKYDALTPFKWGSQLQELREG